MQVEALHIALEGEIAVIETQGAADTVFIELERDHLERRAPAVPAFEVA